MRKLFTLLSLSLSLSLSLVKADYWTQKSDFPLPGRSRPIFFSIGTNGYVGCGENGGYHSDFWEYDPVSNTWTQKANFPGMPRSSGASFSIGNKGYAGLGIGGFYTFKDFWEYDPLTNLWTQLPDFPGLSRQVPISFSCNGKGYAGTGLDSSFTRTKEFWQYDPVLSTWNQKTDVPGHARSNSYSLSIGTDGYAGGGLDSAYTSLLDLYKYNTLTDSWTQVAAYPGIAYADMAAFSINGDGYMGTGQIYPPANTVVTDFWQYNPSLNQWTQKATYLGAARDEAAFFSIGNNGYIGLGGINGTAFFSDFWKYTFSDSTTGNEEIINHNLQFTIFPNPAKEFIIISYPFNEKENIELTIFDVHGKKVYETKLLAPHFRLPASHFQKGIYIVELTNDCLPDRQGKQKAVKKFVKE